MKNKLAALNQWHKVLAGLLAIEAVAILIAGKAVSLPVTTSYLAPDSLASKAAGHNVLVPASRTLFDMNIGILLVVMLAFGVLGHLLITTYSRATYEKDLRNCVNRARWWDYGVMGGLLLIAVALVCGISDLSLLLTLVALNGATCLFGWLLECYCGGKKVSNWLIFLGMAKAAAIAWVVLLIYVLGAVVYGGNHLPGYVYGILVTLFITLLGLALNTYWLQRLRGRWSDYIYGEKVYLVIGFVSQLAIVTLIFIGLLKP